MAGSFIDKMRQVLYNGRFKRLGGISFLLLFFCSYAIFLVRYIDPAVIYSSSGSNIHNYVSSIHALESSPMGDNLYGDPWYQNLYILHITPDYLREILLVPGGCIRLIVTLVIYACRFPIAGALAITGIALLFSRIFVWYLQGMGARRPLVLHYIPPFFILTVCAWYELRYCTLLFSVAGALGLAVFYRRLQPVKPLVAAVLLSVLFWIAWYFMQWGALLLLLFIVIQDFFCKQCPRTVIAVAAAVNAVLLYCIDVWLLPLNMTIRWNDFMLYSGLPLAVIGFFPLTVILYVVVNRWHPAAKHNAITAGLMIPMGLLVSGTVCAGVWLCRDPVNRDTRTVARTMHHILRGQWDAVLHEKTSSLFSDFPQKAGPLQVFMVHAVNHALYRTGRIGASLFMFPQAVFSDDPLLMLHSMSVHSYVNWIAVLDLVMDLGMVNTAEKIAGEIMENMGPYPEIIYRRALIQIAKGNNDAAAVYLNKLSSMPFYRREATRLLGKLATHTVLDSEPRIMAMHTNRDTIDYFLFNNVSPDVILKYLLQSNQHNKAAYDYLVTYYLLTGQLQDVAILIQAATSFGYTVLPRYWEEALCLYQSVNTMQTSSGISFRGMRQETVDRFLAFSKAWLPLQDDPNAAEKLLPSFGDSYFYFSIFKFSPGIFHELR